MMLEREDFDNMMALADAESLVSLQRQIRDGAVPVPREGSSWREVDAGVWVMSVSQNLTAVYYMQPVDTRIELEAGDYLYGIVMGASISVVNGNRSLVIGMDDGTYVYTHIAMPEGVRP